MTKLQKYYFAKNIFQQYENHKLDIVLNNFFKDASKLQCNNCHGDASISHKPYIVTYHFNDYTLKIFYYLQDNTNIITKTYIKLITK